MDRWALIVMITWWPGCSEAQCFPEVRSVWDTSAECFTDLGVWSKSAVDWFHRTNRVSPVIGLCTQVKDVPRDARWMVKTGGVPHDKQH